MNLGKLPQAIANQFVANNPAASLGSLSGDGLRRIIGPESLAADFVSAGGTLPTAAQTPIAREPCVHLGTKLSVAVCCGQMYACNFHKGKKCAPTGIAKDPFLSCSTCSDFEV